MWNFTWFGRVNVVVGIIFLILGIYLLIDNLAVVTNSFKSFIMSYGFFYTTIGIALTSGSLLHEKES